VLNLAFELSQFLSRRRLLPFAREGLFGVLAKLAHPFVQRIRMDFHIRSYIFDFLIIIGHHTYRFDLKLMGEAPSLHNHDNPPDAVFSSFSDCP
jgi:hypothetical protein